MISMQVEVSDDSTIFDPDEALDRIGGDEALLREMIDIFGHCLKDDMDKLGRSIEEGDQESIRRNAHRIKGSIGNFGMNRAYNAAYAIEQGFCMPPEVVESLFLNLKSEIYELNKALMKYMLST
jgi:HPt (histidine-containing phosphotransfer) domain-containing protein